MPELADTIGAVTAFLLTLAVLSYLAGDNPFYRLAVSLFVGVTAGYAVVIVWHNILWPRLILPLLSFNFTDINWIMALVALLVALLLLAKAFRVANAVGSLIVAFVVGVGAAVAVGGAVTGTLLPQMQATFVSLLPPSFDLAGIEKGLEAWVMVVGTLTTLAFFYYGGRGETGQKVDRPALVKLIAPVGKIFIGAAFGAMYAGALFASLTFFAHNLYELWLFIQQF